ncbi:MAG: CrcB family protein [Pseudomonadota bacterium]
MMSMLYVAFGGAAGASLRYAAGLAIGNGAQSTLFVNVIGSFALGVLMGWLATRNLESDSATLLFLGVGVLGAFTTFSAFSRETVHFFLQGDVLRAGLYAVLNMVGAISAFAVALLATQRVLS